MDPFRSPNLLSNDIVVSNSDWRFNSEDLSYFLNVKMWLQRLRIRRGTVDTSFKTCRRVLSNSSSNKETIPPPFSSEKDAVTALDEAASYDERLQPDQVKWTTSSYHEVDEAKALLNKHKIRQVKKKKRKTKSLLALTWHFNHRSKHDRKKKFEPNEKDDSENSVLLFPGQGAQFLGMGKRVIEVAPSARNIYDRASSILNYDLLKVIFSSFRSPSSNQFLFSTALLGRSQRQAGRNPILSARYRRHVLGMRWGLVEKDPEAVKNCVATAGFSVGEITALIFSGALTLEDGVRLVFARAEAMQYASEMEDSGTCLKSPQDGNKMCHFWQPTFPSWLDMNFGKVWWIVRAKRYSLVPTLNSIPCRW